MTDAAFALRIIHQLAERICLCAYAGNMNLMRKCLFSVLFRVTISISTTIFRSILYVQFLDALITNAIWQSRALLILQDYDAYFMLSTQRCPFCSFVPCLFVPFTLHPTIFAVGIRFSIRANCTHILKAQIQCAYVFISARENTMQILTENVLGN